MNQTAHSTPSVYCVILNMNGKTLLKETLDSVFKMTYPNFRVVVCDNGSQDGSLEEVRTNYPAVKLIENGSNLGFGGGNNVGMRYSLEQRADWIFLLNNDISVDPEMLTELMNVAMTDPAIGMLSPKIYYFTSPELFWYAGGKINFWAGVISHRGLREKENGQYDRTEDTEYITGCAMLMNRKTLESVGMFDPVYHPIYTEDADLSERVRRAGFRLVYVPAAKLWHKVSAFSGGGLSPFKTSLKVEHNLIFFKRYAKWYHWLTIPFSIGSLTITFIIKELMKGNLSIVSALFKGFGKAVGRLITSS